jgi:hypothetical protein
MNQMCWDGGTLPPFKCDVAALESLAASLRSQCPGDVYARVDVELGQRFLVFDSFDELANETTLPAEIRRFALRLESREDRRLHVSLDCGMEATRMPRVSCSGSSEGWCAGVLETTRNFAARYRTWPTFVPWSLLWFLAALALLITWLWWGYKSRERDGSPAMSAYVVGALLAPISVFAPRWFRPRATLVIRREDNFWKRNQAEIVGITAIVVAVATVVAAAGAWWPR